MADTFSHARELILKYGWNSTCFQIVNPGIRRWFSDKGDAVVGYVTANGVRVVAGAPVCEITRLGDVVGDFESDAQRNNEGICYFAAEERLGETLANNERHSRFVIGAQPVWDPHAWPSIVASNRSLRAQINRAGNKGVTVSEWPVEKATGNERLAGLLADWLRSKGLPPLRFMVESDTLSRLENRRIFVGEANGEIVGFVVLSPVAQRNGWLFEQFPHRPGAPNGTVEAMIDTAMRSIADDGAAYATLGLSPLSKRADVELTPIPLWLKITLVWLRKHGQRFYNFDGLDAFKSKLKPTRWEPVFAVSLEPRVSFKTLYAIAGAFSGNAPVKVFINGLGRAVLSEMRWLKRKLRRQISKNAR